MYYSYECGSDVAMKALDELRKKINICEVMPSVRFRTTKFGEDFDLVCTHPDMSINCGTNAKCCEKCINKEKSRKESDLAIKKMVGNLNIFK